MRHIFLPAPHFRCATVCITEVHSSGSSREMHICTSPSTRPLCDTFYVITTPILINEHLATQVAAKPTPPTKRYWPLNIYVLRSKFLGAGLANSLSHKYIVGTKHMEPNFRKNIKLLSDADALLCKCMWSQVKGDMVTLLKFALYEPLWAVRPFGFDIFRSAVLRTILFVFRTGFLYSRINIVLVPGVM